VDWSDYDFGPTVPDNFQPPPPPPPPPSAGGSASISI
jgi:hypothetical protein